MTRARVRIGLSYDQGTAKYPLYRDALLEAGKRFGCDVEPVWLAGKERPVDAAAVDAIDAIVMTGGADVEPRRYGFADPLGICVHAMPERDEVEIPILAAAFERGVPILAICRGMQLLNVWRGGSLIPDLPNHEFADDAVRHRVALTPGSLLSVHAGVSAGDVSSAHHQAVDRLGDGLRVAAKAPDGVVEAIEWSDPAGKPWLVALQWHPERMRLDEPLAGWMYAAFLEAATVARDDVRA